MAVTFHALLPGSQVCSEANELLQASVRSQPSSSDIVPDPIHLLLGFSACCEELAAELREWTRVGLTWTFADADTSSGVSSQIVSDVVSKIMQHGGYEGSESAMGLMSEGLTPEELHVLRHLQSMHYACCVRPAGRECWQLTIAGLRAMQTCAKLRNPRLALTTRESVPVQQRSVFELINMLIADGWEWRAWLPKSKRRRRHGQYPDKYVPGEAKVWFSTAHVGRHYLLALLCAEDGTGVVV